MKSQGQILVLAIVVVGVVLFSVMLTISGSLLYFQNASYSLQSAQAVDLAEAGVDKAVASLNAAGGSYSGESETVLPTGSFSVSVTSSGNYKIVESTGYVPSKTNPRSKKTVKVRTSKGTGISFKYGVQVGEGGLELGNNNQIVGSVYSNGSITAVSNNQASGDIWIAGGTQPSADQSVSCTDINCADFLFGRDIGGENRLDVAQGFRPSASGLLNKVSLNLKKVGNPADATVRVLADKNGQPDKNTVLATGTLRSNLVTAQYGWVDLTFTASPNLTAGSLYWLMVDTSGDPASYWSWQNDTAQSYVGGQPAWSADWKAGNPAWNSISGDLNIKTFVGGVITRLDGGNNFSVSGDVHANTVRNATIAKDAYYQVIENSTAANYFPGSEDPPPKSFPISAANISAWKQEAENAGVTTGDVTACQDSLGPGKIAGNVTFDNNCTVTIKSPVWVTGNFTLNNNNLLSLSAVYGDTSGVIIVDGVSELKNNNRLQGTSSPTSILMLLSTYNSQTSGVAAIKLSNTGNTSFLYADSGIIEPGNSNNFKELTAWKIKLSNNSVISYETGLASAFFSAGPSGSYSLVKGTYQLR